MSERVFLFDVDGTLTPARQTIDPEFEKWFLNFCENNPVFLVSGSDRPKTIEQIGQKIYDACMGVYQCNGNEHWYRNRRIKSSDWKPSYEFNHYLINIANRSPYPFKTDEHIELRTGMLNFSTVGRAANQQQRKAYYEWDNKHQERKNIAAEINRKYPDLHASIGGHISIDIYPRGADKSQVSNELQKVYDEIIFFGDKTEYGGNDYPIALAIELGNIGTCHSVTSWEHTWELLRGYENAHD